MAEQSGSDCTDRRQKTFTVHLSDEMAAMIDLKRKEWGLRSRGEVIERLLGWMVEPNEAEG